VGTPLEFGCGGRI